MELTSLEEVWKRIPPEEKLELMSAAHARGVGWVISTIILGGTLAVGLQLEWLLWGSMLFSPMIFQAAAGKAWRSSKPITVLQYLAAKTAARRYAFVVKAQNLHCSMIFRGALERIIDDPDARYEDLFQTKIRDNKIDVWISLFGDAIVIMSERYGGAELQFGHVLNDKLLIESNADQIGADYTNEKEIFLEYEDRDAGKRRIRLTSRHPAALVVFEKKARTIQQQLSVGTTVLEELEVEDSFGAEVAAA